MELTPKQMEQQDYVDNIIFEMICQLSPNGENEEWNIEIISEIREMLVNYFKENNPDFDEMLFYPYKEI